MGLTPFLQLGRRSRLRIARKDESSSFAISRREPRRSSPLRSLVSPGTGRQFYPVMSSDATRVALFSQSTNLDPGPQCNGCAWLFVKDLANGSLRAARVASSGEYISWDGGNMSMSGDGNWIVFATARRYLPEDTNSQQDVYLWNVSTGELRLLSTFPQSGATVEQGGAITDDGSFVVLTAYAPDANGTASVFVVRVADDSVSPVATPDDGTGWRDTARISGDGSHVALVSWNPGVRQRIWVVDRATGQATLASTADDGSEPASGTFNFGDPSLSGDGSRVAFSTYANFDSADDENSDDVYVKDLATGDIQLASVTAAGVKGNNGGVSPGQYGASYAQLSGDGTRVGFLSNADNLGFNTPGGSNFFGYVKELSGFGQAPPTGLVTRSGATLLMDGQPFRPIGLNVYNANSTNNCWYDMASGSTLDDALSAMGPGVNTVRAWFFQSLATQNGTRDWTAFDHTLAVAHAHGVKVIATLGNQWADCEPASGYKSTAWYEGGYTQPDPGGTVSYRDWVQQVAARYKNDPTVLAWQLLNEPEVMPYAGGDCSTVPESRATADLAAFAQDVSGAIKAVDPNHLVSLGTIGSGQCGAQDTDYASVMSIQTLDLCEFHDYNPNALIPGDIYNGLQRRVDQCSALNKPLLVGESGIDLMQEGGVNTAGIAKRAAVFSDKACAQLTHGVAGLLLWAWNKDGPSAPVNYPQDVPYDIGPTDPVLNVLAPWSNPSHACSAPSSPSSLIAAAGDHSASVSWSSPSSDGGSAISGYTVTANPGGAFATVGGSQTTATVNGLSNGLAYTFTVTAASGGGTSPPSSSSNAVTPTAGSVGVTAIASPSTATTVASATDPAAAGGTATSLTVPAGTAGGSVAITQGATTQAAPTGYVFGGIAIDITAPAATAASPLQLAFTQVPPSGSVLDATTLSSAEVFRTEGTSGPIQIPDCSGAAGAADPDPCVAGRQYVTISGHTDIRVDVLTSSASRWNTGRPAPSSVAVSKSGYAPTLTTVQLGGTVTWRFTDGKSHTVTDALNLGAKSKPWYDSGNKTSGTFAFSYAAAGTFTYSSTVSGDKLAGTVSVPLLITHARSGSPYVVTWANRKLSGYVFDVQYRFKPAGKTKWTSWTSWQHGAVATDATFTPSLGAGTYSYRSDAQQRDRPNVPGITGGDSHRSLSRNATGMFPLSREPRKQGSGNRGLWLRTCFSSSPLLSSAFCSEAGACS